MKPRLSFVSGPIRRSSASGPAAFSTGDNASLPTPEPMSIPQPEGLGGSGAVSPRELGSVAAAPLASGGAGAVGVRGRNSTLGLASGNSGRGLGSSSTIKPRNKSIVDGMGGLTISGMSSGSGLNDTLIVLRTGFLKKKGVINSSWRKRYFVLTDKSLSYYDDEPKDLEKEEPKGMIQLLLVTKVEHHSDNSKDDFMFDVITPARVYRLQAESISEMEAWIATISGTAANSQQHLRRRGTGQGGIARDMTEDSTLQGEDITAAFGGPHQPADLKKWELWKAYDVSAWLETFQMSKHRKKFYAAGITGAHLKGLSSETLNSIGVTEKAEQIKILNNVQRLMSGGI